jgi:hypothetical protein
MDYKQKYLKYKSKYLALQQTGGASYTESELNDSANWKISFQSIASGSTARWIFSAQYRNQRPFVIYEPTTSVLTTWDSNYNKQKLYALRILQKFLNTGEFLYNDYDWNNQ